VTDASTQDTIHADAITAVNSAATDAPGIDKPVAKRVPVTRERHGDAVVDEYAWLLHKEDPDTIAYLEAENAYTQKVTAGQEALRDEIFAEIKRRTQETDLSVPLRKGGYWYYSRQEEGKQYSIACRTAVTGDGMTPPQSDGGPLPGEEIMLDGNVLAEGHDFFQLGVAEVSPDGRLLAYSTDFSGDERFTLRVKNLSTGQDLDDVLEGLFYGAAWSADSSTLHYVTTDDAWRPAKVWRHTLGTPRDSDILVHDETDERFWTGVDLSRDQRFLIIEANSKVTSEVWLIPADDPAAAPRLVRERRQGVEYTVEPDGDRLLILHNDGAEDFELSVADLSAPDNWSALVPHTAGVRLEGVDAHATHVVVALRKDGLSGLRVLPKDGEPFDIAFPEPIYTVGTAGNPEYETRVVRLAYASLVTPDSIYDYLLDTGELVLRKQKPVLDGFDPGQYEQHREWAVTEDGTRVPISLVARKGTPRDGSAPLVLYGYGSYETSIDPWFSIARLSLLDRGVVFAVAHIRGGGEMGRRWYEEGKLTAKRNTFTDFIAAARHLQQVGWTSPDRTVARGASAGGLLVGAVANLAPELFAGIVAQVPFVDALNTILDPELPLTVTEWEEWGNPIESAEVYAYMKSYSPYENVAARAYPSILALGGLNDTRVLHHEPAKWVARLRAVAPEGDYLLKTEMGAGHGGPSGRYDAWRDEAFITAWILTLFASAS
jgi:oligopeptidase B